MKRLEEITEAEMIAIFLGGEIESGRFGDGIKTFLQAKGLDEDIIRKPNIKDVAENHLRFEALTVTRRYGDRASLFDNFPQRVSWFRCKLTREELANARFIVYSYWIEITNKTLRASDAIPTIKQDKEIFGVSNQQFWKVAKDFQRGGRKFPEMIFVGRDPGQLVILEGHVRLTGYLLAAEGAPKELTAIVGLSEDMDKWKLYSYESFDKIRSREESL